MTKKEKILAIDRAALSGKEIFIHNLNGLKGGMIIIEKEIFLTNVTPDMQKKGYPQNGTYWGFFEGANDLDIDWRRKIEIT